MNKFNETIRHLPDDLSKMYWRRLFKFLILVTYSCCQGILKQNAWIQTNIPCTPGIYENDDATDSHQRLKELVERSLHSIFKGDPNITVMKIQKMDCKLPDISFVNIQILTNNASMRDVELFQPVVEAFSNKTLPFDTSWINSSSLIFNEKRLSTPRHAITIEFGITNEYACEHRKLFKQHIAERILQNDGIKSISESQVIIFDHDCNQGNRQKKQDEKATMQFYISDENNFLRSDEKLTRFCMQVISQMIFDGTIWKLGFALRKSIKSASFQSVNTSSERREFKAVLIGSGIVIGAFILLVIFIKHCCSRCSPQQQLIFVQPKEFSTHDVQIPICSYANNAIELNNENSVVADHDRKNDKHVHILEHGKNSEEDDDSNIIYPPPSPFEDHHENEAGGVGSYHMASDDVNNDFINTHSVRPRSESNDEANDASSDVVHYDVATGTGEFENPVQIHSAQQ